MNILPRDFYNRPTLDVAKDLIGKQFNFYGKSGIITETEAYVGEDDKACHAVHGRTPRTEVMFGPPGFSYVYFIYGMYFCLNFVTEKKDFPAAVLIRGIRTDLQDLDGPGKLCKIFGITKDHNGLDVCGEHDFYVADTDLKLKFKATPRIGITAAKSKKWRFVSHD